VLLLALISSDLTACVIDYYIRLTDLSVSLLRKNHDVRVRYSSCIRGFHVYKNVWEPYEGEILQTKREINDPADKYTIAVLKDSAVVGHVP
jgi:hypothetical protein